MYLYPDMFIAEEGKSVFQKILHAGIKDDQLPQ